MLPLSLDTFAVSAALGSAGVRGRERLRISLLMAAFETSMPVVGLLVGTAASVFIGAYSRFIAAGLLAALAAWMLVGGRGEKDEEERARALARARGWSALGLGLSISLDELAMGAGFGLLRLPLLPALALIFVQAALASQLGMRLGGRVAESARERSEMVAAAVLIVIAVVIAVLPVR